MKILRLYKKAGIIVFLVLELVLFSIITPHFFSLNNFVNLLRQIAMLGIASIGIAFLMLGGLSADLSIAGQIPVLSMLCGVLMVWIGLPVSLSVLLTILGGILLGFFNGMVIRTLKINPFVVTLSTMTILQGIALLFTGGVSISSLPRSFSWLGQGSLFGIPSPLVVLFCCVAGAQFVLSKTYFGRAIYAMGGNAEAARLAGINTQRMQLISFMISGFFASIAALMISSRTMISSPTAGNTYAFDTMTACVLGGISFAGGEGKLWGAFVGVLIIGIMTNAMTLMNVGSYWQEIIKGIVLILALFIDRKQRELNV